MKFTQECRFLGFSTFHSNKKNKDYNKLDLHLPDNNIISFFITDALKETINFEPYSKVLVEFEVKILNGVTRVNVLGVHEC